MAVVVKAVRVAKVELVKDKIIALWLHFWLKRIAKKYPDFFMQMLEDLDLNKKAIKIMKARYIDRLTFKEIPDIVHVEERQVYRIHQKAIRSFIHI